MMRFSVVVAAALFSADALSRGTPAKIQAKAAVPKSLVGSTKKAKMMTEMTLGPFESKVAACEYCYQSHTKALVVPNCLCFAYDGDSGPNMFCTATAGGVSYSGKKDGACRCVEKDMAALGATTCGPI